ncbi:MAG: tyrosine-protein phosphatase [Anaeromyxobacter sp.]
MRRLLLAAVFFAFLGSAGCGSSEGGTPSNYLPVTVTDQIKATGYAVVGDQAVFVYDHATWAAPGAAAPAQVLLSGSFNGWVNPGWELSHSSADAGVWFLVKPLADVLVPGNSGQPEFKFVVDGAWLSAVEASPAGYHFLGNNLLVQEGDDLEQIAANEAQALAILPLSSFDLEDAADKATLSNFRQVPGMPGLFRSYHPYKKSRPALDTEDARIAAVKSLMASNLIGSVVSLTGIEAPGDGEALSAYHLALVTNSHQLGVTLSYNIVYYQSGTAAFWGPLEQVIRFIADQPAPVLVHCRLGTDRTGATIAVLEGLAGKAWADIAADYQASNDMGIGEFRDYHLLQYSLEHMTGVDLDTHPEQLQAALIAYFVTNTTLTEAELAAVSNKLTVVPQ